MSSAPILILVLAAAAGFIGLVTHLRSREAAARRELALTQALHQAELTDTKYQSFHERTDSMLGSHGKQLSDGLGALEQRITQIEQKRIAETSALQQMVVDLRDVTALILRMFWQDIFC